jgi:hypothetical protein
MGLEGGIAGFGQWGEGEGGDNWGAVHSERGEAVTVGRVDGAGCYVGI